MLKSLGGSSGGGSVSSVNGETGAVVIDAADVDAAPSEVGERTINFVVGSPGVELVSGFAGFLPLNIVGVITGWTLIADQVGDLVLSIWKQAGGIPDSGDSIVAAAPPTLTDDQYAASSTLTGWTTSIAQGDVLGYNITSVDTIEQFTISLSVSAP